MTAPIRSPSFPKGLPHLRSEAEVRSGLKVVTAKTCPWCGEDPPLAYRNKFGCYTVGCESDDCAVNPQVSGKTLAEAWQNWNARRG